MGNIYAYGKLSQNPDTPVHEILKGFAALIAKPESVDGLTNIFTFMENHSWWGSQMPPKYKLGALPCKLASYDEALAALNSVAPVEKSPAPLLISPRAYLERVQSTLNFMKAKYND